MNKETGASLLQISIFVVIAIIVIAVCVSIFGESYRKRNINEYVAQMELIQEKVVKVRKEYKLWENYNPNETGNYYTYLKELGFSNANNSSNPYIETFSQIISYLEESNVSDWDHSTDSIITNYCYFSSEDLQNFFEIKEINFPVIINFYTGNVISGIGVYDGKSVVYRLYDTELGKQLVVPSIYDLETIPKIEIVENYGLSQKVKITLDRKTSADIMEIYYYSNKTDENKKICSNLNNYTYNQEENSAYFNIEHSGEYTFIVEDTNFVQYPKIEYQFNLCNTPILLDGMMGIYWDENGVEKQIISEYDSNWYNYSKNDFRMANMKTEDGNYWVWIPRYLYKETTEGTDVEFAVGTTSIATNNMSMNGYQIQQAFSKNNEVSGIWVAKFQGNIKENKILFKPAETLTLTTNSKVEYQYKNLIKNNIKKYFRLMSENDLNAALILSKALDVEISNNLVHYAGGSPNIDDLKNNTKYSSTNNIYGIFDLLTSENEITSDSKPNEIGRFRGVISIK